METLEHNGATYVKVSVLAKRFNYTTDYIGQLCRQGKVEAKLVGRSWFVRESSLLEHGSDRLKNTRPNEILSKINTKSVSDSAELPTRVAIFPQLSKHSHRTLLSNAATKTLIPVVSEQVEHLSSVGARYSHDSSASLPKFNYLKPIVSEVSDQIVIEPTTVSGQKIAIHTATKGTKKLYFSSLPEVSLQGNLTVLNLDAEDEYAPSTPVELDEIPFEAPKKVSTPTPAILSRTTPRKHLQPPVVSLPPTRNQNVTSRSQAPSSRSSISFFIPLVFLFSVAIAATLLSLSSLVESDGSVLNQSLRFNLAQVSESLLLLR